jgi:hypothetical protein
LGDIGWTRIRTHASQGDVISTVPPLLTDSMLCYPLRDVIGKPDRHNQLCRFIYVTAYFEPVVCYTDTGIL